jgi:hypothetical protein
MADGPLGSRAEPAPLYKKIFTGFRIALDIKKLLLAAAGIFCTYLGWWFLSFVFYYPSSRPEWRDYEKKSDNASESFRWFQRDRKRWSRLHELAGPPSAKVHKDAGDVAQNVDQLNKLQAVELGAKELKIEVEPGEKAEKGDLVVIGGSTFHFKLLNDGDAALLRQVRGVRLGDLRIVDEKDKRVRVGTVVVVFEKDLEALKADLEKAQPVSSLSPEALEIYQRLEVAPVLPAGKFRVCPWSEPRGENPYLLVSGAIRNKVGLSSARGFFTWLLFEELPVLIEPLLKFLSPVYYLFEPQGGGFWNTLYLVLIILWTLAVWGYFGGAITRLAAVQVARNEKAPLGETLAFVNQRVKHFILAPVMPLVGLGVFAFILGAFGFVEGWIPVFGDIVIAGLLWPIVIVLGLIMAVLLVGLFGWPLMYPTISVEGSDSFDALSRSYSYFYQKPWRYLGYSALALLYGAALTFFVGFMGSLLAYLGQLGVQGAPGLASVDASRDRTPVYLVRHAPTSFGWRDLFLSSSDWAEPVKSFEGGREVVHYQLKDDYLSNISWYNNIGSWLVGFWLGLLFLLIVGFSYSYFFTAGTIVYFLMRKVVDDTELDEVHLEEEDVPQPPARETVPTTVTPPGAVTAKPNTVSLNLVEPPATPPTAVSEAPKPDVPPA